MFWTRLRFISRTTGTQGKEKIDFHLSKKLKLCYLSLRGKIQSIMNVFTHANSEENPAPADEQQNIGRDSLVVLFLFAFTFRMIYVIQSVDNPLFGVPVVDAHVYESWARRMAEGVWLWDNVGNYLPVYPAFLALQKIVFGPNPLVNKVIQGLMGSLTSVLLARTAARAWNRKVGLTAGYLFAAYWMMAVFDSEKFAESFAIFFQTLTLYILLQYPQKRWAAAAAGFSFALSAAVRANLFLVFPFLLFWLLRRERLDRSTAVQKGLLFCLGTILIIGPVLLRNYQLTGSLMLRAQATWSLYSGIAPEFEGLHPPTGILFDKYMHLPLQAGATNIHEIERYWGNKIIQIAREDPLGIALNFIKRMLIFCNAREWSQEFDVYAYRGYSKFLALPWVGFWLVGPLGLLGLVTIRRPTRDQWLLIGYTVIGFLSIIPFKTSDRYRLPTAALMVAFAAVALWQLLRRPPTGRRNPLILQLVVLAVFCAICWPDWPRISERRTARHEFYIGLRQESLGRLDQALESYEASMKRFDWDPDSPYRIGRILAHRGEEAEGLKYLKEALRREPDFPRAINEVARIYLQEGRIEAAQEKARASLQLNPMDKDTLLLLAEIHRREGNTQAEVMYLERAALVAKNAEAAMIVAERKITLGNPGDALRLYEAILFSRDVDRYLRVQAAMKGGITAARLLNDRTEAGKFWNQVRTQFKDFTFFALQAEYFLGEIDEQRFSQMMDRGPLWQASAAYAVGLKRRLDGDPAGAAAAFEKCLTYREDEGKGRPEQVPYSWAWEDLQSVRGNSLESK